MNETEHKQARCVGARGKKLPGMAGKRPKGSVRGRRSRWIGNEPVRARRRRRAEARMDPHGAVYTLISSGALIRER